ncbi:MAG: sporulation protein YqfD [Firmicutes bacterium]|nr:sporulation protein YqfD [Bacillota bacterium]
MNEWKIRRWKTVRIEGFQLQRFLNLCSGSGIGFRSIRSLDECTMTVDISMDDLDEVVRLAGNRWKITIGKESGLEHSLRRFAKRTATWTGLLLFCGILYFQSQFISQIQITGYEQLTEEEIRSTLGELGFAPGAKKSYDLSSLKTRLFHELDNITWVGIQYDGTLAKVEILEGAVTPPLEDTSQPANLCSDKEGYLESLMVKEGIAMKKPGDYVKPGDVLISGIVPIEDKTYQREETELVRHVHAQGEAKLRVLHRIILYQPRCSTILEKTGRWFPGIKLSFGNRSWDSDQLLRLWDTSRRKEIVSAGWNRPIPGEIAIYLNQEVIVRQGKRLEEEIKRRADQQIRAISKEILPKSAEIIKKDLSFSEKENIIIMNVLIHALEETGVDQPILQ